MIQTYRKHMTSRHTRHLAAIALIVFLVFNTGIIQAQTKFSGMLKSVSITDSSGANRPPTANFTYTQDGESFSFDASDSFDSDGTIIKYSWVIGNSTSTNVQTTYHNDAVTDFIATLTVVDNTNGVGIIQKEIRAKTSYFSGFPDETETKILTNIAPESYYTAIKGDRILLRRMTIPAGSSIKNVHYYFGKSISCTSIAVQILSYISDTKAGNLLASANINPQANQWVSSNELSGSQTFFDKDTPVYVGIRVESITSFEFSRNLGGLDYFYNDSPPYDFTSINLGSAPYNAAIVLEYTK